MLSFKPLDLHLELSYFASGGLYFDLDILTGAILLPCFEVKSRFLLETCASVDACAVIAECFFLIFLLTHSRGRDVGGSLSFFPNTRDHLGLKKACLSILFVLHSLEVTLICRGKFDFANSDLWG